MARFLSWLGALIAELQRRRVIHVAAVYAVVAWVVLQVAAVTFPALYLPDWSLTLLVVLALLGLPLALVVAWAFELTPDGVRRSPPPEETVGSARARRAAVALLVGGLLLVSAGAGWSAWRFLLSPSEGTVEATGSDLAPTRIAVLYFDDLSSDQSLAHIAHGFTEALTHELSQIQLLDVVPRTAVKPYRSGEAGLDSIARALRAGSVVEGSVERIGDRLRATVQLADGSRGIHLMSVQVERSGDDLLALRDEIVLEATRLLRQSLGQEIRLRRTRAGTESDEAWSLYHHGLQISEDAGELVLDADTAIAKQLYRQSDSLFARAHALDEDWSQPILARADNALTRARLTPSVAELDVESLREGLEFVRSAIGDGPADPKALYLRGELRYYLSEAPESGETLREAERDLRAAVARDPSLTKAWARLAYTLYRQAQYEEADWAAQKAREADEHLNIDSYLEGRPGLTWLFASLAYETGDLREARRIAEEGLEGFPGNPSFNSVLLNVLAATATSPEDVEEAWRHAEAVDEAFPGGIYWNGRLRVAAVLARVGRRDSAFALVRLVEARDDAANSWTPYYAAHAMLQLGEREEALRRLEHLVEIAPQRRRNLAREWIWEPLREHPDFLALVEEPGPTEGG